MNRITSFFWKIYRFFLEKPDFSEVIVDANIVKQFHQITDFFHITPQVIYYPGCGKNISPKIAYPKAKIYFVEKRKDFCESLKKAHISYMYRMNYHMFKIPSWANLTIAIDVPYSETFITNTGAWWLIICNDHYGVAARLYSKKSVELVWVLWEDGVDDSFLEDYFKTAINDADLRRAGVYNLYKKSVESVNPEVENLMEFIRRDFQKIMGTETYLWVALSVAHGDIEKVLPKRKWEADSASWFGSISNFCIFRKK